MKQCKEYKFIDGQYVPCPNPVEDEIKAWGQIINPVRCKECRTKRNQRRVRDNNNRINWLKNHNCKESNCAPVCTFGDW